MTKSEFFCRWSRVELAVLEKYGLSQRLNLTLPSDSADCRRQTESVGEVSLSRAEIHEAYGKTEFSRLGMDMIYVSISLLYQKMTVEPCRH